MSASNAAVANNPVSDFGVQLRQQEWHPAISRRSRNRESVEPRGGETCHRPKGLTRASLRSARNNVQSQPENHRRVPERELHRTWLLRPFRPRQEEEASDSSPETATCSIESFVGRNRFHLSAMVCRRACMNLSFPGCFKIALIDGIKRRNEGGDKMRSIFQSQLDCRLLKFDERNCHHFSTRQR